MEFLSDEANFRSKDLFLARKFNEVWRKFRRKAAVSEIPNRLLNYYNTYFEKMLDDFCCFRNVTKAAPATQTTSTQKSSPHKPYSLTA
ncbi:MAG: hypothetical protein FWH07_06225 [Oscillospiraceae bacterium]|nr:hypothetical protein [Oscillospiraceae bacterium]